MDERNKIQPRVFDGQKIDSFFIETRVHRCGAADCRHNMADVLKGGRGTYCKYKKISIGMDGKCLVFERRIVDDVGKDGLNGK